MRLATILAFLYALAACSTTATTVSDETVERCSVTDCFNRHQVRDYEVVGNTTMVVYVGGQRCPFLIEFDGTFCDLTFMPGGMVSFTTTGVRQMDMRICARDRHVGIDEGPFSTAAGGEDAVAAGRLPCQIRDIVSLTDDQLLEVYVENNIVAPPPPFGTGQLEVGEQDAEQGTEAPPAGEEPAQPTAAVTP